MPSGRKKSYATYSIGVGVVWAVLLSPAWREERDVKLLGVYSTETGALARIERARAVPGFCDEPDGFEVSAYKLDKDEWLAGFVTV